MKKILLLIFLIYNSCSYPEMTRNEIVYENNFESNDLRYINGGGITYFNNSKVIGNFNNESFTIHLEEIGEHEYIFISFDLYIHGSWDGNSNGFSENDKADKWIMEFKPDMDLFKDSNSDVFETTFSNSPCWPNYCLQQSYPDNFPSNNNPRIGSYKSGLDELCKNSFFGGSTTLYKIEKGFRSSGNAITIRFSDELYQPNAIDKNGQNQQKCDESWSMDNIKIRAINYK